jgi:hypothetical protein
MSTAAAADEPDRAAVFITTRADVRRLLLEHLERVRSEYIQALQAPRHATEEAVFVPPELRVLQCVFGGHLKAMVYSLDPLLNNGSDGLITITCDMVPFGQAFGAALETLYGSRPVRLGGDDTTKQCRALKPRDTEFFAPYYLVLRLEFIEVEQSVDSTYPNRIIHENLYGSEAITLLCSALVSPMGLCEGPQDVPSTLAITLLRHGGEAARHYLVNRLHTPEVRRDPLVQAVWNDYLRLGVEPMRQHLTRQYLIRMLESRGATKRLETYKKLRRQAQKELEKKETKQREEKNRGDVPLNEAPRGFFSPAAAPANEEADDANSSISISSREEERLHQQVLQTEAEQQRADQVRPMAYEQPGYQRPARAVRTAPPEPPLMKGEPVFRSARMGMAILLQLEAKLGQTLRLQFPSELDYDRELRSAFSLVVLMLEEWNGFCPVSVMGDDVEGDQQVELWLPARRKQALYAKLLQWMPRVVRLVQLIYRPDEAAPEPEQEHPDVQALLETYESCRTLEPVLKDMELNDEALRVAVVDETRRFSCGTFVQLESMTYKQLLRDWTNAMNLWPADCLMAFQAQYFCEEVAICAPRVYVTVDQVLCSISMLNRRFPNLHLVVDRFARDGECNASVSVESGANHNDLLPAARRIQTQRDDHVCVFNTYAGCYVVFSSRTAMMRYNYYGMMHEALSRRRPKLQPYFPQALRLYAATYREKSLAQPTDPDATDDLSVFVEGLFGQLMRCSLASEMPDDKCELQPLHRPDLRLRSAMLLPTHERFPQYRLLHGLMGRMKRCMHLFPFMAQEHENQSIPAQQASFLHTCDTVVGFLLLRAPHLVPACQLRRVFDYLHLLMHSKDLEQRKLWYRHYELYYYLWHVKETLSYIREMRGVEDVYRMELECESYVTLFIFPYIYTSLGLETKCPLFRELADVKEERFQDQRVEVHLRLYRFCADPDVSDEVAYPFLMSIRYEYDAIAPYRAKRLWRQAGALPDRDTLKNLGEHLDAMQGIYHRPRRDELAGAEPDLVRLQNHGTAEAPDWDGHTPLVLQDIKDAERSQDPLQQVSARMRAAVFFARRPTQPVGQQLLRTERNAQTPWYFLRREPVFRGDNDHADQEPGVVRPLYYGMRAVARIPHLLARFCDPDAQQKYYSDSPLVRYGKYELAEQALAALGKVSYQPMADFLAELEWFLYERNEPAPMKPGKTPLVTFAMAPYTDAEQKSPWKLDADTFLRTEQLNANLPTQLTPQHSTNKVPCYEELTQANSLWLSVPVQRRVAPEDRLHDPERPAWMHMGPVPERTAKIFADPSSSSYSKRFSLLLKRVRDSPMQLPPPEMVLQTPMALRLQKFVEPVVAAPAGPADGGNRRAFVTKRPLFTTTAIPNVPKRPRMVTFVDCSRQ